MIEPNVSMVSWVFFKLLHEEPVLLSENPFDSTPRSGPSPYESNQAIPYLVFVRKVRALKKAVPNLEVLWTRRFSLWAYPLSGGFSGPKLLPRFLEPVGWGMEKVLRPLAGLLACRLVVVIERV